MRVFEVMRSGKANPVVKASARLSDVVVVMTNTPGRPGAANVVDDAGLLVGIFTDGDLRRSLQKGVDMRATRITEVMTGGPRTIGPDKLAAEAVEIMERFKVNQLLVVDQEQRLVGALNMHDLFRGKVI